MRIRSLSLTNFRVFKRLEIEFHTQLNLFIGRNAQGKTSVLEAIHLISLLTSPLASNDREVVNLLSLEDDIPVARIIAEIEREGQAHRMELRLILNRSQKNAGRLRKELLVDGVQRRLFDYVGFFNSILFLPQMTRIVEDGPDERRRYLDQALSQAYPGYMRTLSNYLKSISRRNALLKQLGEQGGDADQMLYWDESVTENGAEIMQKRILAIDFLNRSAQARHLALTNSHENLEILYIPSLTLPPGGLPPTSSSAAGLSAQEIKQIFSNRLRTARREEIARGITTSGPHRDDVQFLVNGLDMGIYGSRGQIRTVVMALKFAEKDLLEAKSGEAPVLLLDETLAELDEERRSDLLGSLKNGGQSILTTADLDLFSPDFIERCDVWRVEQGVLTKEGA